MFFGLQLATGIKSISFLLVVSLASASSSASTSSRKPPWEVRRPPVSASAIAFCRTATPQQFPVRPGNLLPTSDGRECGFPPSTTNTTATATCRNIDSRHARVVPPFSLHALDAPATEAGSLRRELAVRSPCSAASIRRHPHLLCPLSIFCFRCDFANPPSRPSPHTCGPPPNMETQPANTDAQAVAIPTGVTACSLAADGAPVPTRIYRGTSSRNGNPRIAECASCLVKMCRAASKTGG